MKKTKWSTAQFLSVDWSAHKKAIRGKTLTQQVTLVKFIHRWRPTLQRLHLIDPSKYPSAMCNICKKFPETQNHIYRCNHPACREIQISNLRQIEKKATDQGVYKFLVRTMLKGLHAWMHALPLPHISPKRTTVHRAVREANYAQDDLGWDNLIRGRLHRSWEDAQTASQACTGQSTTPKMHVLVRLLWDAADRMWKSRNEMEHGVMATERATFAAERMDAQLEATYKQMKSISVAARIQLYTIPLERRKKYKIHTNKR